MYKNLSIAVLLVAFGLDTARTTGLPASTPTSPTIVASIALTNQTATIPPTTVFTPTQTGLYRLSVYMTQTVSVPRSTSEWRYNLAWVDDAGVEGTGFYGVISVSTAKTPPSAWGSSNGTSPGNVAIFQAIAGQPVTYSVLCNKAGGAYSLYFTVEQLI